MAFATADDLAARLARVFSSPQEAQAEALLDAATTVIAAAADKSDAWADALDPVPRILHYLCIELAVRVLANPDTLRSFSEQLGAHQYSASFRDTGGGMLLTDIEVSLVRRAVYGRTSGSSSIESIVSDLYPSCGS